MNEYKNILVVCRMIQSSRKAIHYGVSLAQKYRAKLYVIHSIYNPFGLKGWSLGTLSIEKEYQRLLIDTQEDLSKLIASERLKGVAITELIREGEPAEEILKTIAREKIDLLVMLAHTEGHFEHLIFDRDNNELIRRMPCSIMLVKKEAREITEMDEDKDEDERW